MYFYFFVTISMIKTFKSSEEWKKHKFYYNFEYGN